LQSAPGTDNPRYAAAPEGWKAELIDDDDDDDDAGSTGGVIKLSDATGPVINRVHGSLSSIRPPGIDYKC